MWIRSRPIRGNAFRRRAQWRRARARQELCPRPDAPTPDPLLDPIPAARNVDEGLADHAVSEQEGAAISLRKRWVKPRESLNGKGPMGRGCSRSANGTGS